jgi:hypothetical protein
MNRVTIPAGFAQQAARRWPSWQSPTVIEGHDRAGEEGAEVARRIGKKLPLTSTFTLAPVLATFVPILLDTETEVSFEKLFWDDLVFPAPAPATGPPDLETLVEICSNRPTGFARKGKAMTTL